MSELGKMYGKQGGDARAKNLTPEELSAIGRKGALAMWAKKRAAEKKKKG
jgi:general stress protein YciG